MTVAKTNGWRVSDAALPAADFTTMVETATGAGYRPALTDPLFDL